jgi:glycosyltransferase involved in cell wall biosynthesis
VTPLISLKYWSGAARSLGYDSRTVVVGVYAINSRSDFDVVLDRGGVAGLARPYLAFGRFLHRDVHVLFLDGGLLANTALAALEGLLLRLAGRRLVVVPYGSDIAVPGFLGPFEGPVLETYPALVAHAAATRRRVDRLVRQADVVVRNIQPGYLPRWDILWPTQLAIDTDVWRPDESASRTDPDDLVVVHASNHRAIKGTDALVAAVDTLRAEGLKIRLDLVEGRSNEEVREAFGHADVVAEQFVAGYGMTAVEGMSSGKPVLANLSWLPPEILADRAMRECPVVHTTVDTVADRLRELASDPERRAELGRLGREHALRYHSYDAVGRVWDAIFRHVWSGAPLPDSATDVSPGRPVKAAVR